MDPRILVAMLLCSALPALAGDGARVVPGPQPDGSTLLHDQWPIRPVGRQVPLGEFPVNLAVDPSGRFAAVLHSGNGPHAIHVIDLDSGRTTAAVPVRETFVGLAFSADGRRLLCSGGSDSVVRRFEFSDGHLAALPDLRMAPVDRKGVIAGIAAAPGGAILAARLYDNDVLAADEASGAPRWDALLPGGPDQKSVGLDGTIAAEPNEGGKVRPGLIAGVEPLCVVPDPSTGRVYASLWGRSGVAVLDAGTGRLLACWGSGLHPNEMLLSRDGRLFVSNGGMNTVTVLSTADGRAIETLSAAMESGDPPGSMPDSLALSHDGRTLFVANADNNNVAVFDVGRPGATRPLGFIPTGWFPTCVRLTPDDRRLLVVSARGLAPAANMPGKSGRWPSITRLYGGSLAIVDLPPPGALPGALSSWTRTALSCRPAGASAADGDPGPVLSGPDASPIRYVIYVIKENRTYDQVFGDLPQGNGDPSLCLFPRKVTPNLHAIASEFVLLDNFFANAEISASGHEWSTAGFSSEFVEKVWPVEYGHRGTNHTYPGEGTHLAAFPGPGYIWDRAAAAGVSYRSYGEYAQMGQPPGQPVVSNQPGLRGHIDPAYRGWDLGYRDTARIDRFIAELHRFEAAGDMPRLQILRLPSDHTSGAKAGAWTPAAMVADNDLATGRLVDAVSHSRFWPRTAIFVVEDDAQSGPDHVDAHRTEALVASPYARRGFVDSTPYTTCSMLRSIELILGLPPMSQFDAAARPMARSFQQAPDTAPYSARPAGVDLDARNARRTRAARLSEGLDFSREDANDDRIFNQVIWEAVRGEDDPLPAPVRAAFVRSSPAPGADDDGDGDD